MAGNTGHFRFTAMSTLIALFTDFATEDPYVGQIHMVLAHEAPGVKVINLFHHVPDFHIQAASYLLPAYTRNLPKESICIAVIDPGVGGGRKPIAIKADGRWFVGPDNGLFLMLSRQSKLFESYEIRWKPDNLSPSFHGRDLFAPVAGMIARGQAVAMESIVLFQPKEPWPDDLAQVLYIDHYGNAVTGIRALSLSENAIILCNGNRLTRAERFGDVEVGEAFWYENANGMVELAVNQGSARSKLGIELAQTISIEGQISH